MSQANKIFKADSLKIAKGLPSNFIDFIYIDPPFNTGRIDLGYHDKWKDIHSYIKWLEPRLKEIHRVTKGVLCVHLDYRCVHYVKVELDKIFGYKNFVNEIIWNSTNADKSSSKNFNNNYENILIYKKASHTFNMQYEKPNLKYIKENYKWTGVNPDTGRLEKYSSQPLSGKSMSPYFYTYKGYSPCKEGWKHPKSTLEKLDKKGMLLYPKNGKRIRQKWFLSRYKGKKITNLWTDIPTEKDFLYHTQKPLALLGRLIKTFTNEGDIVADFFCGSGTTLVAAKNLGRRWLGSDISDKAVEITKARLGKPAQPALLRLNTQPALLRLNTQPALPA